MFQSVDDVVTGLGRQSYICNKKVATVVYLGTRLQKPILVEGPAILTAYVTFPEGDLTGAANEA